MLNSAFRRLGTVVFLLFPFQAAVAFSPLPSLTAAAAWSQAPAPLPVLYFWTPKRTVESGSRLSFSWSSKGVTSCRAAGAWSGTQAPNGSFESGPVQRDQQYRLTCSGPGGSVTRTINISVEGGATGATPTPPSQAPAPQPENPWTPPPSTSGPRPTLYFWTPKRTVPSGARISFSWSSEAATSCRAEGAWSGSKPVRGSFESNPIWGNQQYRLICSGPGGSITRTIDIAVESNGSAPPSSAPPTPPSSSPPPPPQGGAAQPPASGPAPTLYFWTPERQVARGTRVNFSWSSTNMTSCRAAGAWSGTQPLNGGFRSAPVQSNQEYRLICSGPGGSITRSITIAVAPGSGAPSGGSSSPPPATPSPQPPPPPEPQAPATPPPVEDVELSFSVDSEWVDRGGAVTLTWSSRGADACVASGDWSGARLLSGSQRIAAIDEDQTFSLTCTAGSVTEVATVGVSIRQVLISWEAPRQNVDGSPLTDLAGYRLYLGNRSGSYQSTLEFDAAETEVRLDLAAGSHFFALKAINAAGVESDFSAELSRYMR